jgi:hypothetical protein
MQVSLHNAISDPDDGIFMLIAILAMPPELLPKV